MQIGMVGAGQQGVSQGFAFACLPEVERVLFYDINIQEDIIRQKAKEYRIDLKKLAFASTIEYAVKRAHVIGINTPMDSFKAVAQEIAVHAKGGAVVYDNGSGKTKAIRDIKAGLGNSIQEKNLCYLPLHFFVGRAGTGPEYSHYGMYKGGTVAIMESDNEKGTAFKTYLERIGVKNIRTDLTPERHDEALGLYSHHNTFAVTSLMLAFPQVKINGENINIGRFLSSTRVAAHGANGITLWGPIANDNRQKIIAASNLFLDQLKIFQSSLKENDKEKLSGLLSESFNYTSAIDEGRPAEDIEGDIYDLNAQQKSPESQDQGNDIFLPEVTHIAMPVVFAGVSALTARTYEQTGGEPFANIANSSFFDSIRPARGNPDKAAAYIWDRKQAVWDALQNLKTVHQITMESIRLKNQDNLAVYLKRSHEIRELLPDARKPEDMRKQFLANGPR